MLHSLVSRALTAPDSPSADLYFLNACPEFMKLGVRRLAPTVFASHDAQLVVRHDMRTDNKLCPRRMTYLLDDDVGAGLRDNSLPRFYREKLRLVEAGAIRRLAGEAERIVVSNWRIAQALDRPDAMLMLPYWSDPFAELDHFDPLLDGRGWIDIGFLGSIVHQADLVFLLPILERTLARHPAVRVHIPMRHRLPPRLERHPRVLKIPGLGWTDYRRELRMRRFHITLYPLLETPFNHARSANKLIEHGVVGAAPLHSESWEEGRRALPGIAALSLPNRAEIWECALEQLIRQPERMLALARGCQALARRLNDAEVQRQYWRQAMELPLPAQTALPAHA